MRLVRWLGLPFVVGSFVFAASCADKVTPVGQLMLAVQTDMALPKDVDRVRIEVLAFGQLQFGNEYEVGPAGLKIPATLGIVAGKNASAPVTIRVIAKKGTDSKILREVITTVPTERTALLRVPIQWLCYGQGLKQTGAQVESTCPTDQSCIEGICQDSHVDSSKLPDYAPAEVFGGGDEQGSGQCFDTLACMGGGNEVTLEGGCSFAFSGDPSRLNVAVRLAKTDQGICDANVCFVPLDGTSATGWKAQGGRVTLPRAICEKKMAVVASERCPSKTEKTPTCGPWSSVSGQAIAPVGDAAVPQDGPTDGPGDPTVTILAQSQMDPHHIVVRGEDVYWATGPDSAVDAGGILSNIWKCNRNGCSMAPQNVYTGAARVTSLAISPNDIVFGRELAGGNGEISRCPTATGCMGAPQPIVSPGLPPQSIAFDGTTVYFIAFPTLGKCSNINPGCGGAFQTLSSTLVASAHDLVLDVPRSDLIWGEGNRLAHCPTTGGCGAGNQLPNSLAHQNPSNLFFANNILTWANLGGSPAIWDCDSMNCSGRKILDGIYHSIAVDGPNIYYGGPGGGGFDIGRVGSQPGSMPVLVAKVPSEPTSIAVDGNYVYAAVGTTILRVAK